mgnify:CR=1 FL=1
MPSHYGKKSPAKHYGGAHKNNPEAVVSPGDPEVYKKWGKHSHAASEGKPSERIKTATEYAPFKMKHAGENPMRKNFPAAFKQMQEVPVEPMKNPVSPIQKPLIGKQANLPEHLKKEILAAPFAPLKQTGEVITEDVKRQMKSIEKQLMNPMITEARRQELRDKLLELSTTIKGQEYTDTGE